MGLALSEEKTKLTHWRYPVRFLGYHLHGKPTRKGTSIRPSLSIPHEKLKGIKEELAVVSGYHNIPEIDVLVQMSAIFRGWCNYYRMPQRHKPYSITSPIIHGGAMPTM